MGEHFPKYNKDALKVADVVSALRILHTDWSYTNYIKYLFIQREFKALKARRMIEANSYSISKSFNTASRALKPALREALKHSTSAFH
ncbi:hypothetical protein GCM10007978_18300 [Shewanella hanedai]|nr:hypothetical protein GCM10007978_18300 [Shewanella hanedai]